MTIKLYSQDGINKQLKSMLNLSTRWIDGDHFSANTEDLKEKRGCFSLFLSAVLRSKVQ